MKSKRIVAVLLLLLMLSFVLSTSAYVLNPWKVSYGYLTYKWGPNTQVAGTMVRNGWENGANHIDNASILTVGYSSTGLGTLDAEYLISNSRYGTMTTYYNNGIVTSFYGYLNGAKSQLTSNPNVAQSTAIHELMHTFGYAHTTGTSIMSTSRDRTNIYTLQHDDYLGIAVKY
ncbi:MAG: hypothetical protein JEZ08_16665 [Clostridiales bacterium]|nr:hypothetical protein [Clostridiales bacterium]